MENSKILISLQGLAMLTVTGLKVLDTEVLGGRYAEHRLESDHVFLNLTLVF